MIKANSHNDGVRSDGIGSGTQEHSDDYEDMTVSVFLHGAFLRRLMGSAVDVMGPGTLSAAVEVRIRSLYPGASISVRPAELLDSDWEVEIGELGRHRMGWAARAITESRLRTAVGATIARFRAAD